MSRKQGTLKLSSNIEPLAASPLDARTVVPTLADLTASGAFPYPYVGMIVSVQSEGKAYILTGSDPTVSANWTEIGSGSGDSIQVETLPTASADVLGKVYQYVGATNANYTHNYFYECKEVADSDPTEYEWVRTNAQLEEKYLEVVYSLPSPSSALIGKQYYMAGETPSTIKGHVYECNSTGTDWIDITPMDKNKSISLLTMTGAVYQCITGLKVNRTYLVETGYSIYFVKVITNLGNQSQPKYGFEIELLGQNLNDTTNSFYNYPVYLNNYQDNAENPILAVYVSNGTRTLISVTQISGTPDNDFDFGTFYTSTPPVPFAKSMFYSAASMREAIAPLFSASVSYDVGDIVWKRVNTDMYSSYPIDNIELYRCTTAHSGDWSASHFEKIQLCKDFKSGGGESVKWIDELPTGSAIEDVVYATRGLQCVAGEEFVWKYTTASDPITYASWPVKTKYTGKVYLYYNNTWNTVAEINTRVTSGELVSLTFRSGSGSATDIATYNVGETFTIKITGDDTAFFYAGDSENGVLTQIDNKMYHFPAPSSALVGKTYQYIGDDDDANGFYNGLLYTCVSDEANSPTYYWIPTEEWTGTHAAWEALPQAIKNHYHQKKVNFTDDDPEDTSSALVGEIRIWAGSTAPNSNYRICNGAALSRTDYAKLFAIIGTSFGAGDGSTTYNIPDLREATTKGVGLTGKSNNHIDADGLALGEFIDDQLQDHEHYGRWDTGGSEFLYAAPVSSTNTGTNHAEVVFGARNARIGSTTEVKAVGVNYIIRVK